ncbi:uncharacterized protein DUF397 [Actinomadura pelletieri DSM 43383]|uniref:Uncharacterized protein DUF397 n=1 Tax=Actinomadura pelletieri DSM 43383 TaxID=1120940 RepID=A0A495QI92_9ACTN|nr:DUF397 domain-containing protein [Actinomadura pelletieri]RKS71853.1 uncharacterized protein DUF397 [Actinomadura pelletieri DSM 43383]
MLVNLSRVIWRKSRRSADEGHCVEVGAWRTSSHSAQEGNCVELSAWRKSSRSTDEGNCVEIAGDEAMVLARDSNDPDGPVLGFGVEAWGVFLSAVKSGRLDLR